MGMKNFGGEKCILRINYCTDEINKYNALVIWITASQGYSSLYVGQISELTAQVEALINYIIT